MSNYSVFVPFDVALRGCHFSYNTGQLGGAIRGERLSSLGVYNSSFDFNQAYDVNMTEKDQLVIITSHFPIPV